MKTDLHRNKRRLSLYSTYDFLRLVLFVVALSAVNTVDAQVEKKKAGAIARSVLYDVPSEYQQVGNTLLYYYQTSYSIDIMGKFGDSFYGSTYSNGGYRVAMKVNDNSAVEVDCLTGSTVDGVYFLASVKQQGELARICYTVTNTNEADVTVSLGTHADVMIGGNDRAPISRRIDTIGNTYGLTMKDGNGAQLCLLFGAGLAGVTSVSDFWFGGYYANYDPDNMVGNYYQGDNYMVENGSYDSGMGWCWKDRVISAGATVVFSYLIGVGDVNLEPSSTFEVTPDDPDGWNDLSRPHRLTLEGEYESPAGLEGRIEYAVEDEQEWHALTEMLNSGDEFTGSLVAIFDASKQKHVIHFRTVDNVGNATLLPPIEYLDVSYYPVTGIVDKTYTGDSLYQTDLVCDIDADRYVTSRYSNNVNAGVATFFAEGLFPYTIGRKAYTFTINPQPLSGDISLAETDFVYSGELFTPEWLFTNGEYANLEIDKDYSIAWADNRLPGTASLTVSGKNNYTGSLTATFNIDKAQLSDNLFTLTLPDEDITYDEQSHGASVVTAEGVGEATISYLKQGETELTTIRPVDAGDYTVYLAFADGTLYYGKEIIPVGNFSIYQFSAEEWAVLQTVLPQLKEMGWSQPWDVSQGMKSVSSLQGLTIEKGHVTGLDLSGQNLSGEFPYTILSLPQLKNVSLANNQLSGDIGTAIYAFAQANPSLMSNIQEINISGNQYSGNVGLFANSFPSLVSLDASSNCFEDVYPMISATVTKLDISKQAIARVVPLHLANLSVEAIAEKVPGILLYDHANQTFTPNINLLCTTQDNSWGMTMSYQNGTLSIPYVSEQNEYYGESGDTLNVAVVNNNGTSEGSTFRIKLSFDDGDANFDGKVNVLDLQTTLNYMFEEYTDKPYNFTASNLWKDAIINVQDAVCLVNMLLDMDTESDVSYAANRIMQQSSDTPATVVVENGVLKIKSAVPVSAFDITVSTNQKAEMLPTLDNIGFAYSVKQTDNGFHIIGYSLSGVELPAGETSICEINGGVISHVMLADRDANEINVSTDGTTTGIQMPNRNKRSSEVYRISVGARRAVVIDATGKKVLIKE